MEYKNIFYFYNINSIGGVETFFYYLAKKYKNKDITIFYSIGNEEQIKRLKKYVRVKKYNGEKIKCKKAFFNYGALIIDNVEAEEYIQIIHADYKAQGINPIINPKITKFIGVSKQVCKSFEELTGIKTGLIYNPIEVDEPKPLLKLISATRLTAEKGKNRIIKLGKLLNEKGIPYIWLIFTNDETKIDNPNIVYMKPRLDITDYMKEADFLVQLSSSEAYCFSVVESLMLGKPVIVTDLPVYKEIGLNNNNSIKLDLDFEDIDTDKLFKKYEFTYNPKKDNWDKILADGESTYQKDFKKIVKVKCIKDYDDILLGKHITKDTEYEVNKVRAEELQEHNVAEIMK